MEIKILIYVHLEKKILSFSNLFFTLLMGSLSPASTVPLNKVSPRGRFKREKIKLVKKMKKKEFKNPHVEISQI
jgi:hypothetical protein